MHRVHVLLAVLLIGLLTSRGVAQDAAVPASVAPAAPTVPAAQKAVLVTGASSGIGRNIAESLAARGWFVYAGARKQADLDALNAIENVEAIRLDVTVQAEIDAAVATIRERGRGLYALVNNAGVAIAGPLIETDEADMQYQMGVNVFGPYRVTRAFAPLLIESQGRITTIGSISGFVTSPFFGAYSMSKFAVEAYTDALAGEMGTLGVKVSVVEPGTFNSDISASLHKRMEARGQSPEGSRFEAQMTEMMARMTADRSAYPAPDAVSAAVEHALFDAEPRLRYMVAPNAKQAELTLRASLDRVVQLNRDQPFSLDRDALVAMLDEALAQEKAKR